MRLFLWASLGLAVTFLSAARNAWAVGGTLNGLFSNDRAFDAVEQSDGKIVTVGTAQSAICDEWGAGYHGRCRDDLASDT